jgi:twinkle protein
MNKLLHLEPIEVNDDYRKSFEKTVGSGRVFFYDHWGSLESDNLLSHIRYMAKALGVEFLFLDHLSIVVSGLDSGDERRIIDNTMTKLRALVEECKIGLILVSHLKRPEGRGHENGAETSLAQLRGSASIAQLSDIVCGLERDQQNPETRNITNVRVLKNRFSGETGLAATLRYSSITGRLTESALPDEEDTQEQPNPF